MSHDVQVESIEQQVFYQGCIFYTIDNGAIFCCVTNQNCLLGHLAHEYFRLDQYFL